MKIRRYFFPMYSGVPDDPNGDWVKYEDVKPLLERIKELEKRQCDCADWVDNVDNAALDIIAVERAEVLSLREKVKELEQQLEFDFGLGDKV